MLSVLSFEKMKKEKQKISMATCYDFTSAKILNQTDIDCLLVGDSLAMVMHGHPTTVQATTEMMTLHTACVARGAPSKFLVADMPFLSHRKGIPAALETVDQLMKAGAHAVKIENVRGHEDVIRCIVEAGVPVMGHLGLTPQSIHQLGGFRVQGRQEAAARQLIDDCLKLEALGCFSLVLECVPTELAKEITERLSIPTIGIGAGPHVDGQVLVFQDLLGLNGEFKPKFLRKYLNGQDLFVGAFNQFNKDVKSVQFPNAEESYS